VLQEESGPQLKGITLKRVAEGLRKPVHPTHSNDGTGRLFVVEQAGVIRVVKDGLLLKRAFLDIRKRVKSGGEKGLLSVAFHPEFRENGRLFVNYTSSVGGLHTVISEFHVARWSDSADSGSERIILEVAQPFSNHNGGQIAFGPDGYLYIGMGDGGSGKIWGLRYDDGVVTEQSLLLDTDLNISSFGTDGRYELYVVDLNGAIYRVEGGTRQGTGRIQ